jgi:hypothetical protein
MNASVLVTTVRIVALVIVLVLAAVAGLVVGNAMQGRAGNTAGYPTGWQAGAGVPASRTATASFSMDAIAAVQAIRDADRASTVAAESLTRPTPR